MEKYNLLIKTKDFVDEFAQFEIEDYTKLDFKKIEDGLYEIEFKIGFEKELFDFVYNLVYFSRVIENIYLKIIEFKNNDSDLNEIDFNSSFDFNKLFGIGNGFSFEVDALDDYRLDHLNSEKFFGNLILENSDNLKVDLNNFDFSFKLFSTKNNIINEDNNKDNKNKNNTNNYLALDLVGFNLLKRNYKLNSGALTINSIIPNYCFYLLGVDEMDSNYSIIDPISSLGDIVLEAASFNPRLALNEKNKHNLPIKKLFNFMPPLILNNKSKYKVKVYSIVQNNKVFKNQRENMNFAGYNYKLSQFDVDWLDVKFKEAQVDFVVSQIPEFLDDVKRDKFLKEFFYQVEFIFNEALAVISKKEIDKKYFKENELLIQDEKKIFITNQPYFIYILN